MKQDGDSMARFIDAVKNISEIDYDYVSSFMEDDVDLLRQLLHILEKMLPNAISKLNTFLDKGDLANFTIEVHGLKGSLNSIGAQKLSLDAYALEKAGKSGDLPYCKENMAAFVIKLEIFHRSVAEALHAGDGQNIEPKKEIDITFLAEKLLAATKAAQESNNNAALSAIKELRGFSFGEEIDNSLKEIAHSLDEFECDTAIEQLKVLMEAIQQKNG